MIIDLTLNKDKKGKLQNIPSEYRPKDRERLRLQELLQRFTISREIMNKPYREFNDLSLIQRQSEDQKLT
jgi:hypothetical protein